MANSTAERLKKRSRKTISIADPEDAKAEHFVFKIRALSPFELADHSAIFEELPEEGVVLNPKSQNEKNYQMLKKVILPMMKIFLPMCTMEPKITFNMDEESDDPPIIHIGDIPMEVSSMIFKEILDLSGITAEAEEKRKKKLAEPQKVVVNQPSISSTTK